MARLRLNLPACRRSLLGNLRAFGGAKTCGPSLPTLEAAQPPQRHGSGVLGGLRVGFLGHLRQDRGCELVYVLA